jgi:hydrogenase nickel incorporation protein HypA/HybF
MHELSIAIGIVDAVLAEAEARGVAEVTSVYVRLGALSGVDASALLFAFPLAADGTALSHARLVLEDVPVKILCSACASTEQPDSIHDLRCPRCGGMETRVVQGNEFELRAFEATEQVRT